jgi:hypothetical protein
MNTTTAPFRPELSLKRRGQSSQYNPTESGSAAPFEGEDQALHSQAALQAGWDKLYRARAILEAEQAHLRDDRIAIQGELDALDAREQAVAARELRIEQLELKARIAMAEAAEAAQEKESESTIAKLTRAPFDMARSVFGQKK